jgi:purine-binding chemotaxis protein CheW
VNTGVEDAGGPESLLVCGTGGSRFAVPLTAVRETMRPLPLSPFPGMPPFMLGVARIRGLAVPVVDSGVLTGGEPVDAGRWITLAGADERPVALAVEKVTGIRTLNRSELQALPPLLEGTGPGLYSAIAARDQELLLTLQASHLVPDDVWDRLAEVTPS